MTEISLMALRDGGAAGLAPTLLIGQQGLWRETQPPKGTTLEDTRPALRTAIERAVNESPSPPDGLDNVVGLAISLVTDLVGDDVMQALAAAREQSGEEAPVLRIHASPLHEWIPWELLHDGMDFLGLSFRIARLPILAELPVRPSNDIHGLEVIRSVLGKGVAEPPDQDFAAWQGTFEGLLPAGARAELTPAGDPIVEWPRTGVLRNEADILHVTCHGKRDDAGRDYWELDEGGAEKLEYRFNRAHFNMMRPPFKARRPLVFANACTDGEDTTAPDHVPMATELFALGALNFIGTLAPIRQRLALRFARRFYEALLGRGHDIGTALLDAKRACRADPESQDDPTYLLYCLYGPPEMRYGGRE